MSTKVIKSLSISYGTFSGNVSSVSASEVLVADMCDINSLRLKINNERACLEAKNKALEEEIELLKKLVKKVLEDNQNLKRTLLLEFDNHVEKGREMLWNTYMQISENISK